MSPSMEQLPIKVTIEQAMHAALVELFQRFGKEHGIYVKCVEASYIDMRTPESTVFLLDRLEIVTLSQPARVIEKS